MSNLVVLFVHVLATVARLLGPGGVRSVVAESVLVKQQLPDPQSLAAAVTQSVLFRSPRGRFVCSLYSPRSSDPFGNRTETLDSFEHSPGSAEPKISPALPMQAQG